MRILDKYILREFIGPFLFSVAAFSAIFLGTNTLFKIAQIITKYGVPFRVAFWLFVYSLPNIVALTFPLSMLLASLLSFGRLSASSEITAMRSAGISFARLAAPVFVVALLVSLFSAGFTEWVAPAANTAYNHIMRYDVEKNTGPKLQENVVIRDIHADVLVNLLFARRYDEEKQVLYGVSIEEFLNGVLKRVDNAEQAVWQGDKWVMLNGVSHDLGPQGQLEGAKPFTSQDMPVTKAPVAISREQKKPEEMQITDLVLHIRSLRKEAINTNVYEVELYRRFALPMAGLIFTLIGTPLGLQPNRSSSSVGMGISIIVIFIYYTIMTVSTALGQGGLIHPFWGAWLPNIIGIVAGTVLVHRASR